MEGLHEVSRAIGNLEAKVDLLLERTSETAKHHDTRITSVEQAVTQVRTLAATVSAGVVVGWEVFSRYFQR